MTRIVFVKEVFEGNQWSRYDGYFPLLTLSNPKQLIS